MLYSEENVHVQCRHCNRFQDGRKDDYFLWMVKEYGQERVEEMIAGKYKSIRLTEDWYREKIKEYQRKVKELKEKC